MKHRKYISNTDRHDYLLDNTQIRVYIWLDISFANLFKKLKFNDNNICHLYILGLSSQSFLVKKSSKGFSVQYIHAFNYNEELRYYYQDHYGIKRFGSIYEFNTNVLPSKLRKILNSHNISISTVRHKGHDLFFESLANAEILIKEYIARHFNLRDLILNYAFKHVEIDYDIITNSGVELAKKKSIRVKFSDIVKKYSNAVYASDSGQKNLAVDNMLKSIEPISDDRRPYTLKGFYDDDSTGHFYLKEYSKDLAINRFERTFKHKKQFKEHLGGTSFRDKTDFIKKIGILAQLTFDGVHSVLNHECYYSDKEKLNLAKKYIRNYYKHHYIEACGLLLKAAQCIHTGRYGASPKCLVAKTLELARNNTLIRKKAKGVYVLDWNWILKNKCS